MRSDHTPLAIELSVSRAKRIVKASKKHFDRQKIQKSTPQQLNKILEGIQIPPWQCDIERHVAVLSDQIVARLTDAFSHDEDRPRRSYISDAAWLLRKDRLMIRHGMQSTREQCRVLALRVIWDGWKRFDVDTWPKKLLFRTLSLLSSYKESQHKSAELTRNLKKQLRRDRTEFLEDLARQMPQMPQQEFFQALRDAGVRNPKKPSNIQPLPMVRNAQGQVVQDFEELSDIWRQHFASQEDGVQSTVEELLARCDQLDQREKATPAWSDLPTIFQIERQFRRTKKNRAYFLDGIPGDILHMAPATMASLYFPLMLKQVACQREAFVFKGGFLVPAFKRGDPGRCENYRSLFVSSPIAKALHAVYRKTLVTTFESDRLPLQLGGVPGFSITQPAHILRLHQSVAHQTGRSFAVLFVDVSNAFYSLIRRHIVGSVADTRNAYALFSDLRLPEDAWIEFEQLLALGPAIEASEVDAFTKAMFRQFYENTWFQMRGSEKIVHSRRGSRPGDTFADLCFGFAMAKILKPVFQRLQMSRPEIVVSGGGVLGPGAPSANRMK